MKTCYACHASKPLTAFYRDRTKASGRRNICSECDKAVVAKRKQDWHEAGKCWTCGKKSWPMAYCQKHRVTDAEKSKRNRGKRRDRGECLRCCLPLHIEMDKGYSTCVNCRGRHV